MARHSPLQDIPRHELVAAALQLGVKRPETLTELQLKERIHALSEGEMPQEKLGSGWFSVARHLVASVVEQGFNLPDAARVIRPSLTRPTEPRQPIPTVTLARIFLSQGHTGRARKVLEAVLALHPDDSAARALLDELQAARRAPQGELWPGMSEAADPKSGEDEHARVAGEPSVAGPTHTKPAAANAPEFAEAVAPVEPSSSKTALVEIAEVPAELPIDPTLRPPAVVDVGAAIAQGSAPHFSPTGTRQYPASVEPVSAAALLVTVEGSSSPEHWIYWERGSIEDETKVLLRIVRCVPTTSGAVVQTVTLPLGGAVGAERITEETQFAPEVKPGEQLGEAESTLRAALGTDRGGEFRVRSVASRHVFNTRTQRLFPECAVREERSQAAAAERGRAELSRRLCLVPER